MGHWGTGISSNDTYMEVYEAFFFYYNRNKSIDEIKSKLREHFKDVLSNSLTSNEYWFAMAFALWECKSLDEETHATVQEIIKERKDLEVWKELGASEADLKKRTSVLEMFLDKLSSEKSQAKKRKKIILYSGYYQKGTCLSFKMKSGNYGGLLIVEQKLETLEGENYLIATDIDQESIPTVNDFLNANVLTNRHEDKIGDKIYNREYFWWINFEGKRKRYNKEAIEKFITVGTIKVDKLFESNFSKPIFHYDKWISVVNVVEASINKLKDGEKENISSTVREWIS